MQPHSLASPLACAMVRFRALVFGLFLDGSVFPWYHSCLSLVFIPLFPHKSVFGTGHRKMVVIYSRSVTYITVHYSYFSIKALFLFDANHRISFWNTPIANGSCFIWIFLIMLSRRLIYPSHSICYFKSPVINVTGRFWAQENYWLMRRLSISHRDLIGTLGRFRVSTKTNLKCTAEMSLNNEIDFLVFAKRDHLDNHPERNPRRMASKSSFTPLRRNVIRCLINGENECTLKSV